MVLGLPGSIINKSIAFIVKPGGGAAVLFADTRSDQARCYLEIRRPNHEAVPLVPPRVPSASPLSRVSCSSERDARRNLLPPSNACSSSLAPLIPLPVNGLKAP